jgi:uncharacterized repeat protein (TIGR01451 family)
MLLPFSCRQIYAKSIYAITSHPACRVSVYEIDGDSLEYQMDDEYPASSTGAVGLALDPESDTLFMSYDGNGKYLSIMNAKTMDLVTTKAMEYEFGGMVFDIARKQLYAIQKDDTYYNRVHIYDWNSSSKSLMHMDVKSLLQLESYPYGIALDEINYMVYVSDSTNKIYMYDLNDWSYEGYFEIKPGGTNRSAVGIDVYNDGMGSRYLYSGSYPHGESHDYLVRTNIDDPDDCIEILVGTPGDAEEVAGVVVDDDTGLVYVTTFHQDIRVYEAVEEPNLAVNLVLRHVEETPGGNPADIVLAGDVGYKPPLMSISKVDDVGAAECVQPDDEITYTITFFPDESDHTNVYVTDYLPLEVEFISADPDTGEYNDVNRTYTWYIGDVDGGDPNTSLELVVGVTSVAEPLGVITNKVEIESDTSYYWTTETTDVCCWGGDIIYVDSRATGFNTGNCWDDAYVRLESALARAKKGCGDEIWVASGWYYPTTDGNVDKSFEMVDGVGIYGGFKGDETVRYDRNYGFYKTYLSGDIDPDGQDDSTNVVRADEITSLAVLDGFIITDAAANGIKCDGASPVISHCLITQNADAGLYSTGSGCPTLSHSIVRENGMGVDCDDSTPIIVNNWIHHNYGIGVRAGNETVIRNNTIVHNDSYGVSNCANDDPQLVNCILWHNNSENGYHQLEDCDADYCCITHPTNIAGDDPPPTDPNNNIYYNPLFAYSDPTLYNFHLDPNSPCIDMGDNTSVDPNGVGEKDIDGDDRIIDWTGSETVDMGADEVACGDVFDELDINADGIINLHDFSGMADAWLKKDEDSNWTDTYQKYDLVEDEEMEINIADLNAFAYNEDDQKWLWEACWFSPDTLMMMGMDGGMDKAMAAAPMTDEQIEQAKLDKWYTTRPPHVMTVWEEIKLVEESLDWLEKVWLEDEQLRKEVSKEEWKEFINSLYDWLAQMKEQSAK